MPPLFLLLRSSVACFSYWLWWPALPVPVRVLGYPVLVFLLRFYCSFSLCLFSLFVLCVSQPKLSRGVVLLGTLHDE